MYPSLWFVLSSKSKKYWRLSENRENTRSMPALCSSCMTQGVNFTNILWKAFSHKSYKSITLYIFGRMDLAEKQLTKCWWNWLQSGEKFLERKIEFQKTVTKCRRQNHRFCSRVPIGGREGRKLFVRTRKHLQNVQKLSQKMSLGALSVSFSFNLHTTAWSQ